MQMSSGRTADHTVVERKVKPVGLLRKYEQQENYDVSGVRNVSAGNYTEVDCAPDYSIGNPVIEKKPLNRTRNRNIRRACVNHFLAVVASLVFTAACVVLLVLIFSSNPGDRSEESVSAVASVQANKDGAAFRGNTTGRIRSATKITTEPAHVVISQNLRMYLIFLLLLLTAAVLGLFCCCVTNTNSKCWSRFCGNYKLILYAAFTRLPAVPVADASEWFEASNPYMVAHFNDERARLSYDPGDQDNIRGVHISSSEPSRLPKRYIFVNYHAWQYAGSDTLWAGIVTKLSDAIESTFGSVCVRVFRMLHVERPSKSGPIKIGGPGSEDPRCLYVQFKFPQHHPWNDTPQHQYVLFVVQEFGVVTECFVYERQWGWWYVRYSTDKEAEYAEAALKLDNFQVRRKRPKLCDGQRNNLPSADESSEAQAPLVVHYSTSGDEIRIADGNSNQDRGLRSRPSREISTNHRDSVDSQAPQSCGCGLEKKCRFLTHFRKHPKTVCCGCPYLYCWFFFAVSALLLPVTMLILADHLGLGILKSTRVIPVEVQIFSWLPALLGVLVVVLRFCWAMCHSQTNRIRKSLAGSAGNMKNALGFMNEVKKEVMIMSELIDCVRYTHGLDYKIVLTIDDLDRCPSDKVKSVLEAVNILLSDRSSPFLCLIAVDSRVAVKCIERDMGDVLIEANLTGHEYLKKIINLPFCLPEVSNKAKKKYFGGVIDSADETQLLRKETRRNQESLTSHPEGGDNVVQIDNGSLGRTKSNDISERSGWESPTTSTDLRETHIDGKKHSYTRRAVNESTSRVWFRDYSEFLFHCRRILNGDGEAGKFIHDHLCGNPRNMKRIFNVLSLTTHLMECIEERRERAEVMTWHREGDTHPLHSPQTRRTSILNTDLSPKKKALTFGQYARDAEDLVKWIVAADQWPYRISYILQVVEDLDNTRHAGIDEDAVIGESCTLAEIYEKYVEPEIEKYPGSVSMLTLDGDPTLLRSFLHGSKSLTRGRISSMFHITVNLDQSLRNGISRQRAMPKSALVTTCCCRATTMY